MTQSGDNIALIPARSGSKRVQNKNIVQLNGHPMIAYTISAALESKMFDHVFVSTESKKYAEIAKHYGADVSFLRPDELAQDLVPDIDWVTFTLKEFAARGFEFSRFSILRPTSPLRRAETICRAFQEFFDAGDCDSLRAIEPCRQHPGKMWTIKENRLMPLLSRSDEGVDWFSSPTQSLPEVWAQNASLEIANVRCVTEMQSISGKTILPFKTVFPEGFDLNSPEDLRLIEDLLSQKKVTLPEVNSISYKS